MFDRLLSIIAPHYCYKCGQVADLLCDNCIFNITKREYNQCLICNKDKTSNNICCGNFTKQWCAGERRNELKKIIDDYKFNQVFTGLNTSAKILHSTLPDLPEGIIITNIPTIQKHIRQRGYDHTKQIAKRLAKIRKLKYQEVLSRKDSLVQHQASRKQRIQQVEGIFQAKNIQKSKIYLLIDDICTTGSSLEAGAKALLDAGAKEVWVAVIARQKMKDNKK